MSYLSVLLIAVCVNSPLRAADRVPGAQQFMNLGQLLNAGGRLMTPKEFKDEIVQRMLSVTLPSGAVVDVMYTTGGAIAGTLASAGDLPRSASQNWPVSGSWTIDDNERTCTAMLITYSQGASMMPMRCQFWFKLGDRYYVSDSDEDRSAKLFSRVLKP